MWRKTAVEPRAMVGEIRELVVAYLKQETLGPLKGIARYLAFGVAGSVLVSLGFVLLLLGILRLLQTETGSTFSGNLSWIPYLIDAALALVSLMVVALAIKRRPRKF